MTTPLSPTPATPGTPAVSLNITTTGPTTDEKVAALRAQMGAIAERSSGAAVQAASRLDPVTPVRHTNDPYLDKMRASHGGGGNTTDISSSSSSGGKKTPTWLLVLLFLIGLIALILGGAALTKAGSINTTPGITAQQQQQMQDSVSAYLRANDFSTLNAALSAKINTSAVAIAAIQALPPAPVSYVDQNVNTLNSVIVANKASSDQALASLNQGVSALNDFSTNINYGLGNLTVFVNADDAEFRTRLGNVEPLIPAVSTLNTNVGTVQQQAAYLLAGYDPAVNAMTYATNASAINQSLAIGDLQGRMYNEEMYTQQVEPRVRNLESHIYDDTSGDTLKSNVTNLQNRLAPLEILVNGTNARTSSLETRAGNLESGQATLSQLVGDAKTGVFNMQASVSNLLSWQTTATGQISNHETRLGTEESWTTTLRSEVDPMRTQVNRIDGDVAVLKAKGLLSSSKGALALATSTPVGTWVDVLCDSGSFRSGCSCDCNGAGCSAIPGSGNGCRGMTQTPNTDCTYYAYCMQFA